jgi:1-hydroxycarotenoid 3,4-desaturase
VTRQGAELPVVCIGGGIGGLCAALRLAIQGRPVQLLEAGPRLGGKAGQCEVDGRAFDTGPTVLTMPWVFEALFEAAGSDFARVLRPQAQATLAQHYYPDGSHVGLYTEAARSREAIGNFAGAAAARAFDAYMRHSKKLYDLSLEPFIAGPKPTLGGVWGRYGWQSLKLLRQLDAGRTVMEAVQSFFDDPRLCQLFGRYATYSGGSPYATPATYSLIAYVEQQGVLALPGGLHALPEALGTLLRAHGASVRLQTPVEGLRRLTDGSWELQLPHQERLQASAVVINGGPTALQKMYAPTRRPPRLALGLSALTFCGMARVKQTGPPLAHHNVFFGTSYAEEFAALFARRAICASPTVYLCAADRLEGGTAPPVPSSQAEEPIFCLINAPSSLGPCELETEQLRLHAQLERCGLSLQPQSSWRLRTPADFAQLDLGGLAQIYGVPPHSWRSGFLRPGSRSKLPGIYFCGGHCHPGPGLPMAALSGSWAAQALDEDFPSTIRCRPAATPGGTSTPRATMEARP